MRSSGLAFDAPPEEECLGIRTRVPGYQGTRVPGYPVPGVIRHDLGGRLGSSGLVRSDGAVTLGCQCLRKVLCWRRTEEVRSVRRYEEVGVGIPTRVPLGS